MLRDLSSSASAAAGALGAAAAAAAGGGGGGGGVVVPAEVTAAAEPQAQAADGAGARAAHAHTHTHSRCGDTAAGTEWPLRDLVTKTLIFLRDHVLGAISREESGTTTWSVALVRVSRGVCVCLCLCVRVCVCCRCWWGPRGPNCARGVHLGANNACASGYRARRRRRRAGCTRAAGLPLCHLCLIE